MAITKKTVLDQVEIVKMETWKVLQVRTKVNVIEDDVVIASTKHRTTLHPDITSGSLASQPADVKSIVGALWTDSHIASYRTHVSSSSS